MTNNELRQKNLTELHQELIALLKARFKLAMQGVLGQNPHPHQFKQLRKAIARVKTVLNEKKKG